VSGTQLLAQIVQADRAGPGEWWRWHDLRGSLQLVQLTLRMIHVAADVDQLLSQPLEVSTRVRVRARNLSDLVPQAQHKSQRDDGYENCHQ
jgi:hypothetical protein